MSLFCSKHSLVDGLLFLHFFVMVACAATAAANNEQKQEQNADSAQKFGLIVLVVLADTSSFTMLFVAVVLTFHARPCAEGLLNGLGSCVVVIPIGCISAAWSTNANVCAILYVEAAIKSGVARF